MFLAAENTMDAIEWLKAGGPIVAAAAVAFAAFQYRSAQSWKRAEFVAEQIQLMKDDASAQTIMQILDWDGRRVDLFPDETDRARRWVIVSHETFALALRPHDEKSSFSTVEARIRDLMDRFLDHFERFSQFVDSGLVGSNAFKPYLEYWIDVIADDTRFRPSETARSALWVYIETYHYRGTQALMRQFGKVIDPSGSRP